MNQEKINSILFDAVNDADLSISEIPSLDLYLEQIIRLISDKNSQGSEIFADRVPTKTMVNNYSKAELITPLKGKTYNKEQIIQILLTNSLKNTLSIAEIKSVMDCIYSNSETATADLYEIYEKYISIKNTNRQLALKDAETLTSDNKLDDQNILDAILLCLAFSSLADYFKCMSKSLLKVALEEVKPAEENEEASNEEEPQEDKKAAKKAKKAAEKAAKKAAELQKEESSAENNDTQDEAFTTEE